MPDNLYIFRMPNTQGRSYKLSVYAPSVDAARTFCATITSLYAHHAGRVPQAREARDLASSPEESRANQSRIHETALLARELKSAEPVFNLEHELIGDAKFNSFFGRRSGSPNVNLSVYDPESGDSLDDFDCSYTNFNNYPEYVNATVDIINHQANDPAVIDRVNHYYLEFRSYILTLSGIIDPVLSKNKMLELKEKFGIDKIDFDLLARRYSLYVADVMNEIAKYKSVLSDASLSSKHGVTPLMRAAARDDTKARSPYISNLLMDQESIVINELGIGKHVDATDIFGRTALMYVVLGATVLAGVHELPGRAQFTRLLLERGADPMIKDNLGKTALDYFQEHIEEADHPAILILRQAMEERMALTAEAGSSRMSLS